MEPLRVSAHGWKIRRKLGRKGQVPQGRARADDVQLLLELSREIHRGDMHRHGAALDARKVQKLLRHAQDALRLLVHDRRRTRALGFALEAAVGQRLAEADEAGQRRLELVRDVGQEITLDSTCPLDGLGHAIERRTKLTDLIRATDADPA